MILRLLSYRVLVLFAVITVGAGVIATVSSVAAQLARRPEAPEVGRPVVLLLHGRGQLGRDSAATRAEWQRALAAGVGTLIGQPLLGTSDVRLVWYADVLDPASSAGCDDEPSPRSEPTREDEGDVLQRFLGVTSTLFTSLYESMPPESRSSMRGLVGDVLYLGDRWRRCAVERRLEFALTRAAHDGRPVILVAHSLGSLVAYSYLRTGRPRDTTAVPSIQRFVTLGSMLGIPELQEVLLGRTAPLSVPRRVRSWVNVRHAGDPFAVPLTDSVSMRRGSLAIRDVVTSSPAADAHDIVGYLRDPTAARAIAWAWCNAFKEPHARAAACHDIGRDVP